MVQQLRKKNYDDLIKYEDEINRLQFKLDALKKLYEGGKMKKEFDKSIIGKKGSSMDI